MTAVGAVATEGPWTVKTCRRCRTPRLMPKNWTACPTCVAGGAPSGARSEYLVALPGAKRRRLWLGFELEEFVGASGISLPTLRKAERGEPVREGTAIKIARALDTTVEELSRG